MNFFRSFGTGEPGVSRRFVLAGLLTSVAGVAVAGAPKTSPYPKYRTTKVKLSAAGSVEDLIASAGLSGKVGFVVADAETGKILEQRKPLLGLPPASVMKALTTMYGLETLGSDYRFKTRILVTGPVENGRVNGDLYLVGGGDPTLDTDALGALAKRLKEAGVREVGGKAFIYSGALPYQQSIDPGQPDHLGYNPSLSGLNLNYNRVFFEWKSDGAGYAMTMDARAVKYRPRVAVATMKIVDRRSPIFAYQSEKKQDNWTVAKHALGRRGGRWLPVRKPDLYAAEVFHTLARSHGIVLPVFKPAKVMPRGTVLAEWKSRELVKVLRSMMYHSTNLIAEAVGVSASRQRGKSPGNLKSSGKQMASWVAQVSGTRHAKLVDHSGLGDQSRISANEMVKVLLRSGWNGPLRSLMKKVPVKGKDGKEIKNHPIKIQAKTGTLNFVSSLAGYVTGPDGRKLVFAVFTADMPRRGKIKRIERERPRGAREWNRRSKMLQQALIARWVTTFGA